MQKFRVLFVHCFRIVYFFNIFMFYLPGKPKQALLNFCLPRYVVGNATRRRFLCVFHGKPSAPISIIPFYSFSKCIQRLYRLLRIVISILKYDERPLKNLLLVLWCGYGQGPQFPRVIVRILTCLQS